VLQGFKMVRLGIGLLGGSSPDTPTLRQDALWYPSLPPNHLCLNENLYTGHPDNYTGFEPMFWINVGAGLPRFCHIEMQTSLGTRVGPITISGEDEERNSVFHMLGRGGNSLRHAGYLNLDDKAGESIDYLRATIAPIPGEHQCEHYADYSIRHGIMTGLEV
jgi:hypothetical protein